MLTIDWSCIQNTVYERRKNKTEQSYNNHYIFITIGFTYISTTCDSKWENIWSSLCSMSMYAILLLFSSAIVSLLNSIVYWSIVFNIFSYFMWFETTKLHLLPQITAHLFRMWTFSHLFHSLFLSLSKFVFFLISCIFVEKNQNILMCPHTHTHTHTIEGKSFHGK